MGIFDFFRKKNITQNINFPSGRPARTPPPKSGGWYRFVDKNTGEKSYVGKSINLLRRKNEHINTGKLNTDTHHFEHVKVPENLLSKLSSKEVQKIKKYGKTSNLSNKNKGGGGRT